MLPPILPPKLSVTIITLNAATQLADCLASVQFADEIIVVDSGSTDATVAIATQYGAKVMHQEWLGFGRQKQFAVSQASHDWVLCLDADERVTPQLAQSLQTVLHTAAESQPTAFAFRFPRCNRFLGRYLRHGEGYPDWSLRFFHRHYARWSEDAVHEKVILSSNASQAIGELQGDLLHDSAETISSYLTKQNRYTSLAAEMAFQAGKRSSATQICLSPILRFIKFYLIRQGWRDGIPGLIHILIGCFNSLSKYAKLYELQQEKNQDQIKKLPIN